MASRRVTLRVVQEEGCPMFRVGDLMVVTLPADAPDSSRDASAQAIAEFVDQRSQDSGAEGAAQADAAALHPGVGGLPEPAEPKPPEQPLVQDIGAAVNYLRSVPIFAPLPASFLARLAHRLRLERYDDGQVVLHKGTPGQALYVVRSGHLHVCDFADESTAHVLTRLRERDCFGEMSILTNTPTAATVIAQGEVTLYAVTKPDFEVLLRENPFMAASFTRLMASRLVAANFRIVQEGNRAFGGKLSVMSLVTVLQVLADSQRSGTLEVRNDDGDFGEVAFRDGQLFQARCGGQGGVDAVHHMLSWQKGSFSLNPKRVPREDLVRTGVMNILLEGMRQLDEAGTHDVHAATDDVDLALSES